VASSFSFAAESKLLMGSGLSKSEQLLSQGR
jgi:hypothetical protein